MADVVSVNVSLRLALVDDGRTIPLEVLLDAEGDDTEDTGAAVCAVAPLDGKWLAIDLRDFDEATIQ